MCRIRVELIVVLVMVSFCLFSQVNLLSRIVSVQHYALHSGHEFNSFALLRGMLKTDLFIGAEYCAKSDAYSLSKCLLNSSHEKIFMVKCFL